MQYYCLMYEFIWIFIEINLKLNCAAGKKLTCKLAAVNINFLMYEL